MRLRLAAPGPLGSLAGLLVTRLGNLNRYNHPSPITGPSQAEVRVRVIRVIRVTASDTGSCSRRRAAGLTGTARPGE